MKKRALQLISLLLLFCMAGSLLACDKEDPATEPVANTKEYLYEEDGFTFHEQITMTVGETVAGATHLTYHVINDSDTEISFKPNITLKIKTSEGWELAPWVENEYGERTTRYPYYDTYIKCEKHSEKSKVQELQTSDSIAPYEALAPGEYQLIKNAKTSDGYSFDLVAYFTVEGEYTPPPSVSEIELSFLLLYEEGTPKLKFTLKNNGREPLVVKPARHAIGGRVDLDDAWSWLELQYEDGFLDFTLAPGESAERQGVVCVATPTEKTPLTSLPAGEYSFMIECEWSNSLKKACPTAKFDWAG